MKSNTPNRFHRHGLVAVALVLLAVGCDTVNSTDPIVATDAADRRRPRNDGGVSVTDAGTTPTPDAGATSDAGTTPKSDAGTTPADAGTTPADAGTTPADAGTTPADAGATPTDAGTTPADAGTTPPTSGSYDQLVLGASPVAYWALNGTTTENDLSGHGNTGTYKNGAPARSTMPNGDAVVVFNGSTQYLTIPSNPSMSIPTTGNLTWEAWIRPDVLQFAHETDGYVDFLGKCQDYSPTCEWEGRMYDNTNSQGRYSRISGYVFNPTAGLGSAADWQPASGTISAGQWYHVVVEYTLQSQPSSCASASQYPGSINIWVNGVLWSQANHSPTGCMSQYNVAPKAGSSPVNIGRMASDSYFQGGVGKVAIYNRLLSASEIASHFNAMTGRTPAGSCGNTCTLR